MRCLSDRYSAALNSTKLELVFLIKLLEKCGLTKEASLVSLQASEKPLKQELINLIATGVGCFAGAYIVFRSLRLAMWMSLGWTTAGVLLFAYKVFAKQKAKP